MILLRLISKLSQFGMLFCLCLPFLKGCDGCGEPLPSKEVRYQEEMVRDSIARYEMWLFNRANHISHKDSLDFAAYDASCALRVPEHSPFEEFLSDILMPNGDFSGLGLIWISVNIPLIGIHITLCLFLLTLLISIVLSFFRGPRSKKWVFILSAIELFSLLLFYAIFREATVLYGFWVTTAVCLLHLVLAWYIWKRSRAPG